VFTSDLRRAVETAEIAVGDSGVPILHDWRLRECNYGLGNGMKAAELHQDKRRYLTAGYPEGESWTEAVERVGWFLRDLSRLHKQRRVLVIGHVATRWGLQHHLEGRPVADLIDAGFEWQLGWEYDLPTVDVA
jgi:broad specificity phosphatase PhoE